MSAEAWEDPEEVALRPKHSFYEVPKLASALIMLAFAQCYAYSIESQILLPYEPLGCQCHPG